jgi:maleate isomerase
MPLRIGLIVPSSNTVMEPDFHRHFQPPDVVSTARILLESVTRDAEIDMLQDLPRAVQSIRTTAPSVVVFGCTSAGSLGGLAHDQGISQSIEQQTGAPAVTVLQAVMRQFSLIRPRTVAVFTPYDEDLTESVAECVAEAGYPPVKAAGMGIRENLEIGKVTPAEIVAFVQSHMAGITADCLFLSCTNWRALEAIELLQSKLGLPIVSSNQAAIETLGQMRAKP